MSKVELAVSSFREDLDCSQSLLSTYGPEFGLSREIALRIADAFGGGMGRMGETCGAVTGAFMALSLRYGRSVIGDTQTRDRLYSMVVEFTNRFRIRNGSTVCRELLSNDIHTSQGLENIKAKDLFLILCPKYVQDAAEIVEELLIHS
jgi:C_GCAxxG_C_C family probable redox protein